jgi:hypothetical protein
LPLVVCACSAATATAVVIPRVVAVVTVTLEHEVYELRGPNDGHESILSEVQLPRRTMPHEKPRSAEAATVGSVQRDDVAARELLDERCGGRCEPRCELRGRAVGIPADAVRVELLGEVRGGDGTNERGT